MAGVYLHIYSGVVGISNESKFPFKLMGKARGIAKAREKQKRE